MGSIAGTAAAPAERKEGAARRSCGAGTRRRLAGASAMSLLCVRGECADWGARADVSLGSPRASSGRRVITFSKLYVPSVLRGTIMLTHF